MDTSDDNDMLIEKSSYLWIWMKKYFIFNVWAIVYLLSISEKIIRNDMLFRNSKVKHPIEKIKAEKETAPKYST